MKSKIFIISLLKGFGQIMLQGNIITGLLFIIAICYDSFLMGLAGIISNAVGILTAKLLKYDEADIDDGLFGFNATLIGIALIYNFQSNIWVWLAILVGSALSTVFMGFALKKKIPVFTFPFVLITLVLLAFLKMPGISTAAVQDQFTDLTNMDEFLIEGHAFGQVIFQGSLIAGLIFFIGVYLSSPIGALYGFFAVVLSIFIAHRSNESVDLITAGILSFNAVLCGIGFSGTKIKDGFFVVISVLVATYIDIFLIHIGFTTLTLPFVVGMWVTLPIKYFWTKMDRQFIPEESKV